LQSPVLQTKLNIVKQSFVTEHVSFKVFWKALKKKFHIFFLFFFVISSKFIVPHAPAVQ